MRDHAPEGADSTPGAGPPLIGWRSPQHRRTRCRHPPAAPSRPSTAIAGARERGPALVRAVAALSPACWCCSRVLGAGPGEGRDGLAATSSSTSARSPSVTNETNGLERSRASRASAATRTPSRASRPASRPRRSSALKADPQVVSVTADRTIQAFDTAPLAAGETVPSGISRIEAATAKTSAGGLGRARSPSSTRGVDLTNPDLNAVAGTNCITPGARARRTTTATARTSRARSRPATAAAASSASRRARSSYAVKVLGATGTGTVSSLICGIDWVAANAPGREHPGREHERRQRRPGPDLVRVDDRPRVRRRSAARSAAGVTVVAAAGNSGRRLRRRPGDGPRRVPRGPRPSRR